MFMLSLMEFAKGSTEDFQKYVKTLLNELSCNEHEKYLKHLANKSAPVQQATATVVSSTTTPAMTTPTVPTAPGVATASNANSPTTAATST